MVDVIIFDLGNVIVKVNRSIFLQKLANNSDKSLKQISDYYEETMPISQFESGKLKPRDFYMRISADLGLRMDFDEFKNSFNDIFTLNDDVARIIKKLNKDFRLVLLSNTCVLHFEYIRDKYAIIEKFDDYSLSYKVGCAKPHPKIFLDAIKRSKTTPNNCVYFDDMAQFVKAARLMGIKAFQFIGYEKFADDLKKLGIV